MTRNNLREERFTLAHSLRVYTTTHTATATYIATDRHTHIHTFTLNEKHEGMTLLGMVEEVFTISR